MYRATSCVVSCGNFTSRLCELTKFEIESTARSSKRPVLSCLSFEISAAISFSDNDFPARAGEFGSLQ